MWTSRSRITLDERAGSESISGVSRQVTIYPLLSAWALVFVTNAVTFPFPPAWTILAAYYATGQVPLLPLTLGGSAAAALGRTVFAWTVGRFTPRLSAEQRANAEAFSAAAHRRVRWPCLFVVLCSFLPVSSDPLFVAVGQDDVGPPGNLRKSSSGNG
jgi:membrane protein YqaA with SNARE-associated domain